LREKQDASG